ncbi:MAG TPA: sigma-54 dependent transcriptional regulator [Desulfomonilaceae bacterium]|nr:sigma-54 dependent transcriptional regulator [Desulfomonilaceae bacterium]
MTAQEARILIVDDEKDVCDILFRMLKKHGFRPIVANDGEKALEMIRMGMPEIVLLDVMMPGMDGMEVLKRSKKLNPWLPVLMFTAFGGIDGAVQAIKEGADDYLSKPVDTGELVDKLRRALRNRPVAQEDRQPSAPSGDATIMQLHEMMGPSDAISRIISEITLVARSNFSVVIQGETGTGKELVARAIHQASLRCQAPLIPVDCGAIPETLFESELFGHEKGAFTGATAAKPGKFELAQSGTLLLDEIENMPLGSQIKILRATQERNFYRIGGRKPVTVDVRLLVATHEDLSAAVRAGTFSRDLFYRLSEFTIVIPPLRERKEDVIHLSNRFLQATNVELGKDVRGFSEAARQVLSNSNWPGNVRQLRSAVRSAVLRAEEWINPEHLVFEDSTPDDPLVRLEASDLDLNGTSLRELVRRKTTEVERQAISAALRKTGGNKAKAARLLQIDYTTMHAKLKQYGIKIDTADNGGQKE